MLSPAALETLAVVAYRQPLVKSEIDRIRGVDVSGALKGLLEKKLVRIVGRKDVPGKPIIYGTTTKFLEVFNLKDLSELPTLRELKDLQDDRTAEAAGAAECQIRSRMMEERLQKILSQAGVASRRAAEKMIAEGRISVNGAVVTEPGTKADPGRDEIRVDGRLISCETERIYILLHKPQGVCDDPQRSAGAGRS